VGEWRVAPTAGARRQIPRLPQDASAVCAVLISAARVMRVSSDARVGFNGIARAADCSIRGLTPKQNRIFAAAMKAEMSTRAPCWA